MTNTTAPTLAKKKVKKVRANVAQIILNLVFIVLCLCYILPFMMVIAISLSPQSDITNFGFTIFPKHIDFTAYKMIFADMSRILQAYKVTIAFTLLHTALAVVLQATISYPISRPYFRGKKALTWFIFFTMLFNAGMIPSYLVYTKLLKLGNSFWVYVLPGAVSAWNCMIVKTTYNGLPHETLEAAKIDGAGEFRTFLDIVVPMSKPTYATIGFLTLVSKWNDWNTTLVYIRDTKLYSLQYLLQTMLRQAEELERLAQESAVLAAELLDQIPTEPMRFAMALIAAGPVLLIFPWFQKYFSKGLTVGSVKG